MQAFICQQQSLILIDAEPLEEARAEVTVNSLKLNGESLQAKLKLAHPDLVLNMDETSSESRKADKQLKVISCK